MPESPKMCGRIVIARDDDGERTRFTANLDNRQVGALSLNRDAITVDRRPVKCLLTLSIGVVGAYQRCGIGTALYEAAARLACDEGRVLCSDWSRTPKAEGFWVKQRTRGRARCLPGEGHNPHGAPWPCEQYVLDRPGCPAPSLSGARRRR